MIFIKCIKLCNSNWVLGHLCHSIMITSYIYFFKPFLLSCMLTSHRKIVLLIGVEVFQADNKVLWNRLAKCGYRPNPAMSILFISDVTVFMLQLQSWVVVMGSRGSQSWKYLISGSSGWYCLWRISFALVFGGVDGEGKGWGWGFFFSCKVVGLAF